MPGVLEKYATHPEWPGWVFEEDELRALSMIGEATEEELRKLESGDYDNDRGWRVPGHKN